MVQRLHSKEIVIFAIFLSFARESNVWVKCLEWSGSAAAPSSHAPGGGGLRVDPYLRHKSHFLSNFEIIGNDRTFLKALQLRTETM